MVYEEDLNTLLSANAGILAQLSNDPRIYPEKAPMNATLPFLVWTEISGTGLSAQDGRAGYAQVRLQMSAYGAVIGDAILLREAVRLCLQGTQETIGGTYFQFFEVVDRRGLWDDQIKAYRRDLDLMVQFSEA